MGCASSSDVSESQRAQLLRSMVRRERAAESISQSRRMERPGARATQSDGTHVSPFSPLSVPPPPPPPPSEPATTRRRSPLESTWGDYAFPTTPLASPPPRSDPPPRRRPAATRSEPYLPSFAVSNAVTTTAGGPPRSPPRQRALDVRVPTTLLVLPGVPVLESHGGSVAEATDS